MNNKKESRGLKTRRIKRRGRVEGMRHEKKSETVIKSIREEGNRAIKERYNRDQRKETRESNRTVKKTTEEKKLNTERIRKRTNERMKA